MIPEVIVVTAVSAGRVRRALTHLSLSSHLALGPDPVWTGQGTDPGDGAPGCAPYYSRTSVAHWGFLLGTRKMTKMTAVRVFYRLGSQGAASQNLEGRQCSSLPRSQSAL